MNYMAKKLLMHTDMNDYSEKALAVLYVKLRYLSTEVSRIYTETKHFILQVTHYPEVKTNISLFIIQRMIMIGHLKESERITRS